MGRAREAASEDDAGETNMVVSLRRGLDVIRAFRAEDGPLSRQEIVQRTGLPRATASRLIHTLVTLGYLVRRDDIGRYQPGTPLLSLGHALLGALRLRDTARPLMQALADRLDASVALAIGEGLDMLYLEQCAGRDAELRQGIGSLVPMASTAIGRAYLWAVPTPERERLLGRIAAAEGAQAPAVLDVVHRAFDELDERGYCTSLGEWRRGVFGVGAPLVFHEGETVLSLNCGRASLGVNERRFRETAGSELLALLAEIKSILGRSGAESLGFGERWRGV
jgi:DNA-binding IclR family transcriptional regulator